ncbi:MAG TPA: cupin domain-containing protein [Candidatus Acidoferrales bacterium]|nr:cupin domain-containing protein [Candidatus Acidoferrales bacterium]
MVAKGQVIENPASGERIVLRETAADTEGRLLSFDLFLGVGGRVPAGHAHPAQEETFTVISGRMRFRRGFRVIRAGPPRRVVMSRGVYHSFANAGPAPAHVLVEMRPALRMEEVLELAAELGRPVDSGRTSLRRILALVLFMREFRRELGLPLIPPWLIAGVTAPVALTAILLGRIQRFHSVPVPPG